jgi:uncharacterized protein (DUF779 family)
VIVCERDPTTTQETATIIATLEQVTEYPAPGSTGSPVSVKPRYENFIGGHWIAPVEGAYSPNASPATGKPFCEVARSTSADIDLALDAAHAAREIWGETSTTDRAKVLSGIADAIEANLEMLAVAESWENGKPVRETLGPDLPLAVDHFRYFAGDKDTIAYHFNEPLGVVGQIIPFNFPLICDFLRPSHDVLLGAVAGVAVCIDGDQDRRWKQPNFHLGVASGAAGGFSLESLEDLHFTSESA